MNEASIFMRALADSPLSTADQMRDILRTSADLIDRLTKLAADRSQLCDNIVLTAASITLASGGDVVVPKTIIEEIIKYEFQKYDAGDGGLGYRVFMKGRDL